MLSALEGRYITPGPGGDPIRNPDVLPTGKNMHGLDPQSIPTAAAVDVALTVANRLLERMKQDTGAYPQVTPCLPSLIYITPCLPSSYIIRLYLYSSY